MFRLVPFRYDVARLLDWLDPGTLGLFEFLFHVVLLFAAIVIAVLWARLIIHAMDVVIRYPAASHGDSTEQDDDQAPRGGPRARTVLRGATDILGVMSGILLMVAGIFYALLAFAGVLVAGFDITATEDAERAKLIAAVSDASTDEELADLLAAGDQSVNQQIAVHAAAGPTTQHYLALNAKESVRVHMASEAQRLWPEAQRLLVQDESDSVREAYAQRTHDVDPAILVALLHDESHDVAVAAFANPRTPLIEKCGIVQEILEGSSGYDHYVDEIGEMVDYCRSVMEAQEAVTSSRPEGRGSP